jgi:flagella basal body P-ring formation protein FlgA
MKFLLIFLALTNYALAESCNVELFSKIYREENNQALTSKDVIYKTTCNNEVAGKLSQLISSANGMISASFLEKEFPNHAVNITPRKISLLDLPSMFKDQLSANSNLYFFNVQSMNQLQVLSLVEGETAKSVCESCSNIGEKNIKIDIANPIANTQRTLWFTSKILAKVKVLKAKRTLGFQEKNLTQDDFYTEDTFTSMPQNIVSQVENINFYKPNKTLTEGSIITNMDLQAVNLVNYGTPVKVVLKNQNINLSKNAMPVRSAQFGEAIEVQTTNNKKVLGRVIDYNKVVIEL